MDDPAVSALIDLMSDFERREDWRAVGHLTFILERVLDASAAEASDVKNTALRVTH